MFASVCISLKRQINNTTPRRGDLWSPGCHIFVVDKFGRTKFAPTSAMQRDYEKTTMLIKKTPRISPRCFWLCLIISRSWRLQRRHLPLLRRKQPFAEGLLQVLRCLCRHRAYKAMRCLCLCRQHTSCCRF